MFVTIIGRGHSGTRIPTKMLIDSGWYMVAVNNSSDYIPPDKMYEAVQYINDRVTYKGDYEWDFSKLKGDPPNIFKKQLNSNYLSQLTSKLLRLGKVKRLSLQYNDKFFNFRFKTTLDVTMSSKTKQRSGWGQRAHS